MEINYFLPFVYQFRPSQVFIYSFYTSNDNIDKDKSLFKFQG